MNHSDNITKVTYGTLQKGDMMRCRRGSVYEFVLVQAISQKACGVVILDALDSNAGEHVLSGKNDSSVIILTRYMPPNDNPYNDYLYRTQQSYRLRKVINIFKQQAECLKQLAVSLDGLAETCKDMRSISKEMSQVLGITHRK